MRLMDACLRREMNVRGLPLQELLLECRQLYNEEVAAVNEAASKKNAELLANGAGEDEAMRAAHGIS